MAGEPSRARAAPCGVARGARPHNHLHRYHPVMTAAARDLPDDLALPLTSGTEWWQSDGTSGGTFQVEDLVPGSGSSADWLLTFLKPGGVGGTVLLGAFDATNGWTVRAAQAGSPGTTSVADGTPLSVCLATV